MLIKPYVADVKFKNGNAYENLEVVDINNRSVWVRLPDGKIIKRSIWKHNVRIKPVLLDGPGVGDDSHS